MILFSMGSKFWEAGTDMVTNRTLFKSKASEFLVSGTLCEVLVCVVVGREFFTTGLTCPLVSCDDKMISVGGG